MKRVGCAPANRAEVQPHPYPVAQRQAGPGQLSEGFVLSSQKGLQSRPQGGLSVHPGCQHTGDSRAARESFTKGVGSLAGTRPHPPARRPVRGWQFPPRGSHPLLRTAGQVLGGYSEQLYRSRVLSGTLTQDGFCSRPRTPSPRSLGPLLEPWDSPTLRPLSLPRALGAPQSTRPTWVMCHRRAGHGLFHPTSWCSPERFLCRPQRPSPGKCGQAPAGLAGFVSALRKCCAAFGATSCG